MFLNTQSTIKKIFKFCTVIELVFCNELSVKGVYLLNEFISGSLVTPLQWGMTPRMVPVSAGHMQRLEQTHTGVQGVKFAVDTTISTLVLCQFSLKVWAAK